MDLLVAESDLKTEVALRAAFKAIENSKQVLMLPTTILADQHFRTFLKDIKISVIVEVISRWTISGEVDHK